MLAEQTVIEAQSKLDNEEFLAVQLLSDEDVQFQINASAQLIRSSTPLQISFPLNFLQITTQSNFLISSLNTIANIYYDKRYTDYAIISISATTYFDKNAPKQAYLINTCNFIDAAVPAGFYEVSYIETSYSHRMWPIYYDDHIYEPVLSAMIEGFYAGCTPLGSLLLSNLQCLYNISCLELFNDYFPSLNQVYISFNIYFLICKRIFCFL